MKRLMLMACLLGAAAVAQAADYLLPETICLTPKGDALVIGERGAGKVSVRDFQGKELRSVTAVKKVGGFLGLFREERTLPVTGIAMSQDGTLFYTADDGNEGVLFREGEDPVPAGNRPMTPTLSPDGKYVYVCDRFGAKVRKFDAKTLECLAEAPAVREANGCALGKDGKLLFVINMLPDDAAEQYTRQLYRALARPNRYGEDGTAWLRKTLTRLRAIETARGNLAGYETLRRRIRHAGLLATEP